MPSSPHPTSNGLDEIYLAGLLPSRHNPASLITAIETHLDEHDGYLAFSGGKDSLVLLHLALQADPNVPVVFFDSGLEYPETYRYLAQLRDQWDLNLDTIPARYTTLELLAANGTWSHHRRTGCTASLATNNITQPAHQAHERYGDGELWGIRAEESAGRRALLTKKTTINGAVTRNDGTVAYSPVWNWTSREVWGYISRHRLPVNPVYAKLRSLGAPPHAQRVSHLVDASELQRGRLVWLKKGWPDLCEAIVHALPRAAEHV